jgi:cellulose synthase/poly-beta-1,6-N-acetylglucosamine synthase-like glycosyltransferase
VTETLKIISWIAGIVLLLAVLPGSLEILFVTTGALRKMRRSASQTLRDCRLAIVIPAHNEAALIGRCVASMAASAASLENCEIVVVADNCTDATAALAAGAGARVLVRQDAERRGKGYALRFAFDQLQAEGFDAFLVLDADSVVSPNLVRATIERLQAGASAVQCRYRILTPSASVRSQLMDTAFLAFNVLRPRGRSGWGVSAGILGNGFAVHREALQKAAYNAASIVEDLEYHLSLVAASKHVEFINEATVYGAVPSAERACRVQRSRWEGGRLRMAREWVPRLAAGIASGKWRLTEPLLELLTLPLAYHILLLSLMLILPAPFRQFAAGALGVILVHVLFACFLGERPWKRLVALAAAPFYVAWKITTLSAVYAASRPDARWVRTGRDQDLGVEPAQ